MANQRRRVSCCLDGNLCRTVVIFVVQVVSLVLTPLILIFINEAINPVVVAISVAFLLLLILSLVCSMVCRCLYLKSRSARMRRISAAKCTTAAAEILASMPATSSKGGAAGASPQEHHQLGIGMQRLETRVSTRNEADYQRHDMKICTSKTCVTIVSHDQMGDCSPTLSRETPCPCAVNPWELQTTNLVAPDEQHGEPCRQQQQVENPQSGTGNSSVGRSELSIGCQVCCSDGKQTFL